MRHTIPPGALYAAAKAGRALALAALLFATGFVACVGLGAIFHLIERIGGGL